MRHVLVLGASGFIGRQCVSSLLLRENVTVHGVSRITPGWIDKANMRLEWHELNVLDMQAVQRLIFMIRPAYALHLAWYVGHGAIWTTPENLDWVAATLGILRSLVSAGCKRIAVAGSCAEYVGSGIFREDETVDPETLYGKAKMCSRILAEALCRKEEVSLVWPRLFHMYGPRENSKRLVAGLILSIIRNEPFPCSDGRQLRDFLHVEDVASALVQLLFSPIEGVINIGSGSPIALADLLLLTARQMNAEHLVQIGARPRAINDPDVLLPDITRQTRELRWVPRLTVDDGIKDTVQWWNQHRV